VLPFDPYAAMWWATLTTMAEMLRGQDGLISDRQRRFIGRGLFGGMGSLNDFWLDERQLGSAAKDANERLDQLRSQLFAEFQRL
jgi:hypothetical protein